MLITIVLACAFVGLLSLFWFTPVGIPTLKRLGHGKSSPDLGFGYRAEEVYGLLDIYGTQGIAHWRRMLLLDLIFPGVYGALFAVLANGWADWIGADPVWRIVAIAAPILAAAADYAENLLLLGVLGALPRRTPGVVAGASFFTRAKFIFAFATFAVPVLHWAAVLVG
jgi:hypothetical protein